MNQRWDRRTLFAWALILAYLLSFWAAVVIVVVKHR